MNRIFYFLIICSFFLVSLVSVRAGSSDTKLDQRNPIKIIQGVYGFFPALESIGEWHKVKLIVNQTNIPYSLIFKKQYDLLMSKHNTDQDGGPCIDVNLVCNCQDGVSEFYRINQIGILSRNFVKYRVDLKGKDFSARQIFWSFKKIRGSWFVEDMGFSSQKDSILRYMGSCLYSKTHNEFHDSENKTPLKETH